MKRLAILAPAALLAFALSAPTHAAHPVAAAGGASTFDAGALQHVRHGHSSGHKSYRGHPGARGHKQAKRAKSRGRGHQQHSRGHEHHHYYDNRSSRYRHRSSPSGSVNLHLRLPF